MIDLVQNISTLKSYDTSPLSTGDTIIVSGYYTNGDGGGGNFYWDVSAIEDDNGGTIIKPTYTGFGGSGRWKRVYYDHLNVKWFGAKGNGYFVANKFSGTDDTTSINTTLAFARSNQQSIKKVIIPSGIFVVKTICVPDGIWLEGCGTNEKHSHASTVIAQADNSNADIIRLVGVNSTESGRSFWYGQLSNMSIWGSPDTNSSGWGVSFRTCMGTTSSAQDLALLYNLIIRNCPSAGIEIPDGGAPLFLNNIKPLFNNGSGIYLSGEGDYFNLLVNFVNISGDGNIDSLIKMKNLNGNGSIQISGLKSEYRKNNAYGGVDAQPNAIVFEDCNGVPVNINGANHISSIKDGNYHKKPGSLIKIVGSAEPLITWNAVSIRVRSGDTGPNPKVIDTAVFPYTQSNGIFGNVTQLKVSTSSSDLSVTDYSSIQVTTTSGDITISGLTNGIEGQKITLFKGTSPNNLIIQHNRSNQKIITPDGNNITLSTYGGVELICNGTNWFVVDL